MSSVTADYALQTFLGQLKKSTEIRDSVGKLLGTFYPAAEGTRGEKRLRDLFDRDEIQQIKDRAKNDPGRPLEKVLEGLLIRIKG